MAGDHTTRQSVNATHTWQQMAMTASHVSKAHPVCRHEVADGLCTRVIRSVAVAARVARAMAPNTVSFVDNKVSHSKKTCVHNNNKKSYTSGGTGDTVRLVTTIVML